MKIIVRGDQYKVLGKAPVLILLADKQSKSLKINKTLFGCISAAQQNCFHEIFLKRS